MCQTKEVGMRIGATLGEVEKVDANEKGFCLGSYLRRRVSLDVSMPLCRGHKVRLGEYGLKWWISDTKGSQYYVICAERSTMMNRIA